MKLKQDYYRYLQNAMYAMYVSKKEGEKEKERKENLRKGFFKAR